MIAIQKNKAVGFYLMVLNAALAIVSIIRYASWAPAHNAMNSIILIALIAGLAVNIILTVYDNDFLVILVTTLYSIALFQLFVDSIGSFVDAYQGIVMFGDPTQVGRIVSISVLIAMSILISVIAGFMGRVKAH